MRAALTGAAGMLGRTLAPLWRAAGADVVGWTINDFDIADEQSAARAVRAARPDVIVHAAAWTDVDGAEKAPEDAMRVNATGTRVMAAAAADVGARLVYLSTDYVFDGTATAPIPPSANPAPRGAYARSKAAGEDAVKSSSGQWLIARTAWMFGPHGRNFVDTIAGAAREGRSVSVVNDQVGSPTSTRLVSEVLWALVAARASGTWHVTAAGAASWHGVARAVFEAAGADPRRVAAISTAQLGRPAPRPAYSVLDCSETERTIGVKMPAWDDQVRSYVKTGALAPCGVLEVAA